MTVEALFQDRETSIAGKDVPFILASKLPLIECSRLTSSCTTTTTGSAAVEARVGGMAAVGGGPLDVDGVKANGCGEADGHVVDPIEDELV